MLKINGLYLPMLADRMVTGNVFFVGTTSATRGIDGQDLPSHGNDPRKPFASVDYAIGKCTASNDDTIVVLAGHTETLSAAGDWTLDVAGVNIVGIGHGGSRPTITLDTATTTTITVSAANCSIENVIITSNFADVAAAITVSGTDLLLKNISFEETASAKNFDSCVVTSSTNNAADGLSIIGCQRISIDAEVLAFVSILQDMERLTLIDNFDNQSSAADVGHFLIMAAKIVIGAKIYGNTLNLNGDNSTSTVGVFATGSGATCTGTMAYNLVGSLDTTTELIVTATLDFHQFENYYTGTVGASGKLWPAVDSA